MLLGNILSLKPILIMGTSRITWSFTVVVSAAVKSSNYYCFSSNFQNFSRRGPLPLKFCREYPYATQPPLVISLSHKIMSCTFWRSARRNRKSFWKVGGESMDTPVQCDYSYNLNCSKRLVSVLVYIWFRSNKPCINVSYYVRWRRTGTLAYTSSGITRPPWLV